MAKQRRGGNATAVNTNSVATSVAGELDGLFLFDNNFSELDLLDVIEPCEFYSVEPEASYFDITVGGNDEELCLQKVKCVNWEEEISLCINRAQAQCIDENIPLFVNGHFNPVLRVHKEAGYSDAKEKYPNRLELYFGK